MAHDYVALVRRGHDYVALVRRGHDLICRDARADAGLGR